MPVTYEDAREVVRRATEPGWPHGTYCLDDRMIVENEDLYVFNIGAGEYLVGGDLSRALVGGVHVVYKEDGRHGLLASVRVAMDPTIRLRPNPHPTLTV